MLTKLEMSRCFFQKKKLPFLYWYGGGACYAVQAMQHSAVQAMQCNPRGASYAAKVPHAHQRATRQWGGNWRQRGESLATRCQPCGNGRQRGETTADPPSARCGNEAATGGNAANPRYTYPAHGAATWRQPAAALAYPSSAWGGNASATDGNATKLQPSPFNSLLLLLLLLPCLQCAGSLRSCSPVAQVITDS